MYDRYGSQMYSLCLRYAQNKDDANDIFQQGFLLVYENLKQLKNADALSGWIKKIFVNAALLHYKKTSRTSPIYDVDAVLELPTLLWNEALNNLAINELTRLIQRLPSGCRTVFNLYVIDGYTHQEIADKLSISAGTSKSQLFDARKMLKARIMGLSRENNKQIKI